ncbi:sensor histidine kinase [Streptosporangium longisporum]|uniref:histidine kinase n=1 Tax=Streptosporangium longisporum TaxID=46187 RepID=A0ABN3XQN6_9ACTN
MSWPRTPRSQALVDAALAVIVFVVSLALLSYGGPTPVRADARELDALGMLLAACSAVPFVAWRRFPLAVFAVTAGAGVLLTGLGYSADLVLGPITALYLLATHRRSRWTAGSGIVVGGLLAAYLAAAADARGSFPGIGLIHTALPWTLAWFAGERTRLRREQMAELNRRAVDAERETERERRRAIREAGRERRLAVAEERARIARDLHDSAGHAISLIAIRAGAARLRHHDEDTGRSLKALQTIEDLARQTAAEIDQLVGNLRDSDQEEATPLGVASLETLISHHTASGLPVDLDVTGPQRPLGAATDQATYRILQQALTNAARHGAGGARVRLDFTGPELQLTVTNPLRSDPAPCRDGGHGLIGMRERALLAGGSLETGQGNGTFRVRALLPFGGTPA